MTVASKGHRCSSTKRVLRLRPIRWHKTLSSFSARWSWSIMFTQPERAKGTSLSLSMSFSLVVQLMKGWRNLFFLHFKKPMNSFFERGYHVYCLVLRKERKGQICFSLLSSIGFLKGTRVEVIEK